MVIEADVKLRQAYEDFKKSAHKGDKAAAKAALKRAEAAFTELSRELDSAYTRYQAKRDHFTATQLDEVAHAVNFAHFAIGNMNRTLKHWYYS